MDPGESRSAHIRSQSSSGRFLSASELKMRLFQIRKAHDVHAKKQIPATGLRSGKHYLVSEFLFRSDEGRWWIIGWHTDECDDRKACLTALALKT